MTDLLKNSPVLDFEQRELWSILFQTVARPYQLLTCFIALPLSEARFYQRMSLHPTSPSSQQIN